MGNIKKRKNNDDPSHDWCSVPGCRADGRKKAHLDEYPWMQGVQFYRYPGPKRKPKLRRQWLQQVFRDEKYTPRRYHSVCSLHFVDGCPTDDNPIPTLFPRNNYKVSKQTRDTASIDKRQQASTETKMSAGTSATISAQDKQYTQRLPLEEITLINSGDVTVQVPLPVAQECVIDVESSFSDEESEDLCTEPKQRKEMCGNQMNSHYHDHIYGKQSRNHVDMVESTTQTDLTMEDIQQMEITNKENNILKQKFVNKITESDNAVRKYLGVPSISMLFGIFAILDSTCTKLKYWSGQHSTTNMSYETSNARKPGPKRKLTRFHEFLITLLRLRLSVPSFMISDLFGVSESRVSQIVCTWINYMYQVFSPQLKWPSLQKIKKHMPLSFKLSFPHTRVIIDCTEIFIQKPRTPTAQSQTYSNYKGHNTFKSLVGITPSGAFSFVSELWGGNVSDRYITANSGFLDLISAGDEVMADRGFIIRDYLLERRAKLIIPPFTHKCRWGKGKRLNANEIKRTRQIAKQRIHVERAIQRLKSFKLLSGTLPISLKPIASQSVVVAAFLCNLMKPLVRK